MADHCQCPGGFSGAGAVMRIPRVDVITTPESSDAVHRTRAARGALWLSVGSWGAKGTQTVMLLVLARALAPNEFGILAVAALTYNVLWPSTSWAWPTR